MFSNEERKLVEEEIMRDLLDNPQYGLAAYKLIYSLLHKINPADFPELRDDRSLASGIKNEMVELLDSAFQYATNADKPSFYTTGQVSTYFGVSVTTVNNWLREKRISYQGMEQKPSFKQARIPDTAVYRTLNGKQTILREIVQEYETKKASEPVYDEIERIKELVKVIFSFEEKYGGTYQETLMRLGDPESTHDWTWSRDAKEWRFILKELTGER